MLGSRGAWAIIFWLASLASGVAAEKLPADGPPPSWAQVIQDPPVARPATNQANEGIAFALIDTQVNVATAETYVRVVKDLVSRAGVQEGAQFSVSFDPSYQDLTLHNVSVIRGRNTLNRLDSGKVRVMQRELDLERHLYDGSLTAVLFLEDIRVGDRIDYSYTIRGFNPILEGRYVGSFLPQWGTPIQRNRYRLRWPAGRDIAFRVHGGQFEPRITEAEGAKECAWDLTDLKPIDVEDYVPGWYDAYPWVQFSEFASWEQVNEWALRLYTTRQVFPPELEGKVREWQSKGTTPEARLQLAVQFVQEEIRYLGFELGAGSHRPSPPGTVFERRFGDCKDKSFLLCEILKALGLKACPLLVHTAYRDTLKSWLPSPYAFNHVITQVETERGPLIVDPTRSNQRGPVASRFVPNYGAGLAVQQGTRALTPIPFNGAGAPLLSVREVFDIKSQTQPAQLTIYTRAFGAEADRLRANVHDSSQADLQKNYLNFYAQQHPGITLKAPLQIQDFTERNQVETTEHYEITNLWTLSKDDSTYVARFYPQSIANLIYRPSIKLRTMPLGFRYPYRETLRTEVNLPELWHGRDETNTVRSPVFKFSSKRTSHGSQYVMEYEYEAIDSFVPVAKVAEHLQALDQMEEELGYSLTWGNPAAGWRLKDINWAIIALAAIYCCLLAIGAVFLYRYDPASPSIPPVIPGAPGAGPSGLGGWLVLVSIGVVLSPFTLAYTLVQSYSAYSLPYWHSVTSPGGESYHPLFGPYLIIELLGNITILASTILIAFLYFRKRSSFPRVFIIYMLFDAVFLWLDYALACAIPATASENSLKDPVRITIQCLVWIPYMLQSKRVEATFVNRWRRQVPAPSVQDQAPPVINGFQEVWNGEAEQ